MKNFQNVKKDKIIEIIRKTKQLFVRQMMVFELDKSKCSNKFLKCNLNPTDIINVKCYQDGTLDLRGKKGEYRILVPDKIKNQE
jgi:hypothetical protein